jgi:hypothetical protein
MQALTLPASRGVHWLVEGFALFRRKSMPLTLLVLGYLLSMAVVSAVPLIGPWLGALLIPVFSVSLMNAFRLIERKQELPPQLLFSGFHRNLQTLLVLGAAYVAAMLAILGISSLFGDALPLQMIAAHEAPGSSDAPVQVAISVSPLALVLVIPVNLIFHFAPVLVAWHDMSAGKSLFFSLVACLRNWRPLLMALLAFMLVGMLVMLALAAAGGGDDGGRLLRTALAMMASLIFLSTLYAGFYVGYCDIFGRRDVS